jgi:hypothetical protein
VVIFNGKPLFFWFFVFVILLFFWIFILHILGHHIFGYFPSHTILDEADGGVCCRRSTGGSVRRFLRREPIARVELAADADGGGATVFRPIHFGAEK